MKTSSKGIYPRHFKYMQCWEIQPRRRCVSMARLLHTAIWTSATLTSNHRRRILLPRYDQTVPPRCRDSILTTISMVLPPLFIIRKPDDDDYKPTKTSRPSTWLFLEATSKGQGRLALQPLLVDVRMVWPSPLVSVLGRLLVSVFQELLLLMSRFPTSACHTVPQRHQGAFCCDRLTLNAHK